MSPHRQQQPLQSHENAKGQQRTYPDSHHFTGGLRPAKEVTPATIVVECQPQSHYWVTSSLAGINCEASFGALPAASNGHTGDNPS